MSQTDVSSSTIGTVVWARIGPVSRSASIRCQVTKKFVVALAQRPGQRVRPAVARQRRGVLVDDPVPGHVERLLRDLPGEAEAEDDVGLEPAQQPGEGGLVASHAPVEGLRAGL